MENTGERLLTEDFYETTVEHLHRYAFAREYVYNKKVVDIACGEGYGARLLMENAIFVIGVDISEEVVIHANSKYKYPNLCFKQGSADMIPLENESVDVVVSFETIEHHEKHDEMLKEIKRILKSDGIMIMSSPDKENYSDLPGLKNPYHKKELYFEEFKKLVDTYFTHTVFWSQKTIYNSIISTNEKFTDLFEFSGDFQSIRKKNEISNPVYNIVVASNQPILKGFNSIFTAEKILLDRIELLEHRAAECQKNYLEVIKDYENSKYYRLGKFLLTPAYFIKKLING